MNKQIIISELSASPRFPNSGDWPSVSYSVKNSEFRFRRPDQLHGLILPSMVLRTSHFNPDSLYSFVNAHIALNFLERAKCFEPCLAHDKCSINIGGNFFIIIFFFWPGAWMSWSGLHFLLPTYPQTTHAEQSFEQRLTGKVVYWGHDFRKEGQRSKIRKRKSTHGWVIQLVTVSRNWCWTTLGLLRN